MGKQTGKPVSFRLAPDVLDRLTIAAARAGASPGELARDWVTERLAADPPRGGDTCTPAPAGVQLDEVRQELARAVFVVLAGVGPDLDEAAAAELVRTYFLGDGAKEWLP